MTTERDGDGPFNISPELRQSLSASLMVLRCFARVRLLQSSGLGSSPGCRRKSICDSASELSHLGATGRAVGKALRYCEAMRCRALRRLSLALTSYSVPSLARNGITNRGYLVHRGSLELLFQPGSFQPLHHHADGRRRDHNRIGGERSGRLDRKRLSSSRDKRAFKPQNSRGRSVQFSKSVYLRFFFTHLNQRSQILLPRARIVKRHISQVTI